MAPGLARLTGSHSGNVGRMKVAQYLWAAGAGPDDLNQLRTATFACGVPIPSSLSDHAVGVNLFTNRIATSRHGLQRVWRWLRCGSDETTNHAGCGFARQFILVRATDAVQWLYRAEPTFVWTKQERHKRYASADTHYDCGPINESSWFFEVATATLTIIRGKGVGMEKASRAFSDVQPRYPRTRSEK